MRSATLAAVVAIFLVVLDANAFAARRRFAAKGSPNPITQCGEITQPGNYVLGNDLALAVFNPPAGGDCLTISASHVNIDMNGFAITASCPNFPGCANFYGPVGGTGIHILSGADHASISNGRVQGFVDGMVVEADHVSAANLGLAADVGLILNGVSYSTFSGIGYGGADPRLHAVNGPMLSLNGGGKNTFTNLRGDVGTDLGPSTGIEIASSNNNLLSGVNMMNDSQCGGADILLTAGSSFNAVLDNTLFDDCGGGIELDLGGGHNLVAGNSVTILSPMQVFAMLDQNPDCGSDSWIGNIFSNETVPDQISANPESCIH
jgi:hypothetical protein